MTDKQADQVAVNLQSPRVGNSFQLPSNKVTKTIVKLKSVDSVQLEPTGVSAFLNAKIKGLILWKNQILITGI